MTIPYAKLPLLPEGICRDDTQHGKLYFTLSQIRAYGQECFDDGRKSTAIAGRSESKTPTSTDIDRLMSKMGMK